MFKKFISFLKTSGFMITFRDKPMFHPEFQERTDPIDDLVKQKSKEEQEKMDNLFKPLTKEEKNNE